MSSWRPSGSCRWRARYELPATSAAMRNVEGRRARRGAASLRPGLGPTCVLRRPRACSRTLGVGAWRATSVVLTKQPRRRLAPSTDEQPIEPAVDWPIGDGADEPGCRSGRARSRTAKSPTSAYEEMKRGTMIALPSSRFDADVGTVRSNPAHRSDTVPTVGRSCTIAQPGRTAPGRASQPLLVVVLGLDQSHHPADFELDQRLPDRAAGSSDHAARAGTAQAMAPRPSSDFLPLFTATPAVHGATHSASRALPGYGSLERLPVDHACVSRQDGPRVRCDSHAARPT